MPFTDVTVSPLPLIFLEEQNFTSFDTFDTPFIRFFFVPPACPLRFTSASQGSGITISLQLLIIHEPEHCLALFGALDGTSFGRIQEALFGALSHLVIHSCLNTHSAITV